MKQKTFKKTDTVWTVVISALALLLVAALFVGVFGKTKAEYIPAPSTASGDFSGEMLSNYDNLSIELYNDRIALDFENVDLTDYKYVVIDVDGDFHESDCYSVTFGPIVGNLNLNTTSSSDLTTYENTVTGLFDFNVGVFTYIFDLTDESYARLYLYYNGVYQDSLGVSEFDTTILESFLITYGEMHEMYGTITIESFYLYGFEDKPQYLVQHLENHELNLSTCKDSMLYKGE